MTDRNLGIRLSVNGGDTAKKQMIDFGQESQQAFDKVAQASAATAKGISSVDRAVAAAETAFKRTTDAAEVYQQASQRLAEQHKQGAISAERYQGTMVELDKRFRQASTAAKQGAEQASVGMRTLGAVSGELQGGLVALSGRAGIAGNVLASLGPAGLLAAAGIGAVAVAVHSGLTDFMAAEEAGVRLEAVLKATGNTAGLTGGAIKEYAEEFERSSKFSAEQIEDAAAVMLTFKSVTGDTFFQAQTLAADLAAVLKSDLSSATLQLGKALENPVEGINALKRAGVSFTEEQKKLIESLVESGQLLEAQQMVLQTLEGQVGGVAKRLGTEGLGGEFDLAKDKAGDFSKAIGGLIAAGGGLESLVHGMGDGFDYLGEKVQYAADWINVFTNNIGKVGNEGLEKQLAGINEQIAQTTRLIKDVESGKQQPILGFIGAGKDSIDVHKKMLEDLLSKQEEIENKLHPLNKTTAQASVVNKEHAASIQGVIDGLRQEGSLLKLSSRDREIQEKTTKILNDAKKDGIAISAEERAQIEKAVAANVDLASSNKERTEEQKKNKDAIEEYIAKLREETKESAESGKQAEISKALWEAQNIAKREHLALTNDNIAAITAETSKRYDNAEAAKQQKQAEHDLAEALQKAAEKRQEEAKKAQEAFEKPFIDAGEHIQKKFADIFADVAKNGKFNMQDAADYGKDAFFKMAGEIAAAMIFKPVIQPVISQAMGAFSPGSSGGVTSGLGGLSSIGSMAGAAGAINSFGTTLGFSSGLEAARPAAGFVGPMPIAQGSMFGTTTLMGALSGAGIGLGVGSMNLFGGNSTGSTIGGTVGGLAGSYFGPLGSVAGSFIGSGIGGLFGPGAKVSAAEFAGSIAANDNLAGLSYGSKNGDIAQAHGLSDALGQALAGLVANGIDIANENIRGAINSKSGNRFEALGQRFEFDPQDAESVSLAVAKLSVELAKAGNNTGSLGIALQHIQTDGRKAEEIISDLNFAAAYDQLDKIQEPASQYAAQMEAMKKQYQDMIPVAERLGLATDKVTKAQENATKAFQDSFLKPIGAAILEMTDPLAAQIQAEQERYAAQLKDAQALGVATTSAERLHYLKMQELANQAGYFQQQVLANDNDIRQQQAEIAQELANRYQAVGDNIRKTLSDLSYGSLSTLTTKQKKEAAEADVESLYKNAMLGNVDAQEQFADAVKSFLAFDQQLQGSGGTYAEDFTRMQDLLKAVGSNAERQVPIQERIYNTNTAQLNALQALNNTTAGVTSAISDLSRALLDGFFQGGSGGLFSDASLLPKGKDASYLDSMTSVGVSVRQYHTFGRMLGYTGEYGAGGFDAWMKANPDKAASFNQMVVSAGGSPRQFEHGGVTPKNQFFTVGEKGKTELMFSGDSHTVYSAEQSRKLLDGAGGGSGELLQETRELRKDIQALIRVTAASGDMNNSGLAAIASRLAVIESKAKLEAAA